AVQIADSGETRLFCQLLRSPRWCLASCPAEWVARPNAKRGAAKLRLVPQHSRITHGRHACGRTDHEDWRGDSRACAVRETDTSRSRGARQPDVRSPGTAGFSEHVPGVRGKGVRSTEFQGERS